MKFIRDGGGSKHDDADKECDNQIIIKQGMGRCERGGNAIVMRTAKFIIMAIVKNDVFCARASDLTAGEALTKNRAMLEHHPGNL